MLYHKMLEQKNHLLKEIQNLQQLLASCPDGELICAKNGNYITYIHSRSGGGGCHRAQVPVTQKPSRKKSREGCKIPFEIVWPTEINAC